MLKGLPKPTTFQKKEPKHKYRTRKLFDLKYKYWLKT